MDKVKILLKQNKCVACGACEELATEVFMVETTVETNEVDLRNPEIQEKVKLAIEVCPQKVILLI